MLHTEIPRLQKSNETTGQKPRAFLHQRSAQCLLEAAGGFVWATGAEHNVEGGGGSTQAAFFTAASAEVNEQLMKIEF